MTVSYTGRPGVHNDGDGTTEGWFRAPDGGFVTTEPVGSEDWMPLNDYPTAKPTYNFADTVTFGRTVLANGELVSVKDHPASKEFPGGSVTWNWFSRAPVASYLVEDSVGNFRLTERTADNGTKYYEAQDSSISAARQKKNLRDHEQAAEHHRVREPVQRDVTRSPLTGWSSAPRTPASKKRCRP